MTDDKIMPQGEQLDRTGPAAGEPVIESRPRRGTTTVLGGEVYLERRVLKVGSRNDTRETMTENYWVANPLGDGKVEMSLLDVNDQPTGITEVFPESDFQDRFLHQPGYFDTLKTPKERLIDSILDIADQHFDNKEYHSAEYEYGRAVKLDEEHVRGNFGLGKTYLAQGEYDQASKLFIKLANIKAALEPHHKHLFNEFGIELRKMGLYHEALENYHRALGASSDDDHLWFNLGRAFHEDGRSDLAKKMMHKALALNPDLVEAKKFLHNYLGDDTAGAEAEKEDQAGKSETEEEVPEITINI